MTLASSNPARSEKRLVATFREGLSDGGTGRMVINFLNGLPRDQYSQDLITLSDASPYQHEVPAHVRSHLLRVPALGERLTAAAALYPLVRYLRRSCPDVLVAHSARANLIALLAVVLARTRTKIVIVQHMHHGLLKDTPFNFFRASLYRIFASLLYRRADKLVGVSAGVSHNIAAVFNVPRHKIQTIYNPVVRENLFVKAKVPLEHPWFAPGQPPVILAVGRLVEIKDFVTLIRAFANVQKKVSCRLLILGEGPLEDALTAETHALEVSDSVQLLGFEKNPYRYMSRAAVLVLSSRKEALPTVLIEALACGCPVVSTDCPTGPGEILEQGRWGRMVPVANPEALGNAIISELQEEKSVDGKKRAEFFSVERSVHAYAGLFNELMYGSQLDLPAKHNL